MAVKERIPVGHEVVESFIRVQVICPCVCENIGVDMQMHSKCVL